MSRLGRPSVSTRHARPVLLAATALALASGLAIVLRSAEADSPEPAARDPGVLAALAGAALAGMMIQRFAPSAARPFWLVPMLGLLAPAPSALLAVRDCRRDDAASVSPALGAERAMARWRGARLAGASALLLVPGGLCAARDEHLRGFAQAAALGTGLLLLAECWILPACLASGLLRRRPGPEPGRPPGIGGPWRTGLASLVLLLQLALGLRAARSGLEFGLDGDPGMLLLAAVLAGLLPRIPLGSWRLAGLAFLAAMLAAAAAEGARAWSEPPVPVLGLGACALGLGLRAGVALLGAAAPGAPRPEAASRVISAAATTVLAPAGVGALAMLLVLPWAWPGPGFHRPFLALALLPALSTGLLLAELVRRLGPRPDQAERLRLRGAGGLLDLFLRRRRSGRLLLDLGISACTSGERHLPAEPEAAARLFREGLAHLERYAREQPVPGPGDLRRGRRYAAALAVRARCLQGLDRASAGDPAAQAWRRRAREELAGFEDRFAPFPEAVVSALAVRLRAEVRDGDFEAARRSLALMERLRPEDPQTARGHLRVAQAGLEAARRSGPGAEALRRAALESYRTWVERERPLRPEPWIRAAAGLEAAGDRRSAEALYERMLRWFRTRAPEGRIDLVYRVQRHLARLYLERGDRTAARDLYFELVRDRTAANPYAGSPDLRTRIEVLDQGRAPIPETEEMEIP
jgi:hypothetical protein